MQFKRSNNIWNKGNGKNKKGYTTIVLIVAILFLSAFMVAKGINPVQTVMSIVSPTATPTPTPTPTPMPRLTPTPEPTNTPTPVPTNTPTPEPTNTPTPTLKPTPVAIATPSPASTIVPAITTGTVLKEVLIAIDPGHGGRDPGAVEPVEKKIYEKNEVLDICKRVANVLEKDGMKTFLTRETDMHFDNVVLKDLYKRCDLVNEQDATFFISIHLNANENRNYNGTEFYYYNNGTYYNNYSSKKFMLAVKGELMKILDTKDGGFGYNQLAVLNHTKMPGVLIEAAYISNEEDLKKIMTDEFRNNIAEGVSSGVIKALREIGAYKENGKWVFMSN